MPQLSVLSVPLFTLTQQSTMERETLKLNQRLMPTMDTTDMPDLMPMVTDHMDTQLMVTTERDLLMLSQRLMLMLTMVSMDTHMLLDMLDMPMELTHMPMVLTTERDLLMLSQRLMLTTDTMDMPDLMPMVIDHTDTQLMVTT